jgi:hypothetical protein
MPPDEGDDDAMRGMRQEERTYDGRRIVLTRIVALAGARGKKAVRERAAAALKRENVRHAACGRERSKTAASESAAKVQCGVLMDDGTGPYSPESVAQGVTPANMVDSLESIESALDASFEKSPVPQ